MKKIAALVLLVFGIVSANAQVKVQADGGHVTVGKDISVDVDARDISTISTGGNTASVTVGGVGNMGDSVESQGVTVINGKVWIDGVAIPPGVKRHKAKSGTVYRIERKDGAVSVTSE